MGGASSGFDQLQEPFDSRQFQQALSQWLAPLRMDCTKPLLLGWYNHTRAVTADGTQKLEGPDDAVAFAICSLPRYLDTVVDYYARKRPAKDLVDAATNEILEQLRAVIPASLDAQIINTDVGPPYVHVQTVGAVCGEDQHIEAKDVQSDGRKEWQEDLEDRLEETRDPKMWGTESEMRRKIFGVNIHPVWGGWYAYRGLIVLRNGKQASLQKPEPLDFLKDEDKMRILTEYNQRHQMCLWRDLPDHAPENRYSPEEFFFFTETSPDKRRRFLDLKVSHLPAAV
ncbi:unnamed protein product [Effrenium voratum]|uniref:Cyanocobalamin reductase (cyanide-eliminating) n=1 Tax=Effrenium voratum TaxID=2562239 RepID=A0AA36J900_9DINO|nr:unnamed protein product [Effrenium voratum]CAJ1423748.1 unnamed protein product [Effrenium voratum]